MSSRLPRFTIRRIRNRNTRHAREFHRFHKRIVASLASLTFFVLVGGLFAALPTISIDGSWLHADVTSPAATSSDTKVDPALLAKAEKEVAEGRAAVDALLKVSSAGAAASGQASSVQTATNGRGGDAGNAAPTGGGVGSKKSAAPTGDGASTGTTAAEDAQIAENMAQLSQEDLCDPTKYNNKSTLKQLDPMLVKTIQTAIGTDVDGIGGPNSQSKLDAYCGGSSNSPAATMSKLEACQMDADNAPYLPAESIKAIQRAIGAPATGTWVNSDLEAFNAKCFHNTASTMTYDQCIAAEGTPAECAKYKPATLGGNTLYDKCLQSGMSKSQCASYPGAPQSQPAAAGDALTKLQNEGFQTADQRRATEVQAAKTEACAYNLDGIQYLERSQIIAIQESVGTKPDGIWGRNSTAAWNAACGKTPTMQTITTSASRTMTNTSALQIPTTPKKKPVVQPTVTRSQYQGPSNPVSDSNSAFNQCMAMASDATACTKYATNALERLQSLGFGQQ